LLLLCKKWCYEKYEPEAFHFFHPDRSPVIFQVEIGKVVEKADSLLTR